MMSEIRTVPEKENPLKKDGKFKKILRVINHNPFANEISKERKREAFTFVKEKQQKLKSFFAKEAGKETPISSEIIFVPHGSVARGHARAGSDLDGNFWFMDEAAEPGFSQISNSESFFPRNDWGGSILNVRDVISEIDNLTNSLSDLSSEKDREAFKEVMTMLQARIASLFGPTDENEEVTKTIDSWRESVINSLKKLNQKLINLSSNRDQTIHPALKKSWENVQMKWVHFFVDYEKGNHAADNAIQQKLTEVFPGEDEKIERAKKIIEKMRSQTRLPDLEYFIN